MAVSKSGRTHRMKPCPNGCGKEIRAYRNSHHDCPGKPNAPTHKAGIAAPTVSEDRERQRAAHAFSILKRKYEDALGTIERQEQALEAVHVLGTNIDTFTIKPRVGSGTSEGTVVVVASDWHVEENVGPEIGTLNRYSIDIAKRRATQFFQAAHRLTNLLAQDIHIDTMVLALLGDFITNQIHEAENAEVNELLPTHALTMAQGFIIAGIDFLLNHSKLNLVIPCHSGNHGRTTKKTRFTTENGHSLEYLMYLHLAAYYRAEPRVTFIIPEGMHSYLEIYGKTIRFHHGHSVKYQGGVGGIYIPVNKAIAQWNKGRRVDYDVFGHFHQLIFAPNFICNGSLIGYNAFALSIKADYEPPAQGMFLIDKKRGRTAMWPIVFKD